MSNVDESLDDAYCLRLLDDYEKDECLDKDSEETIERLSERLEVGQIYKI